MDQVRDVFVITRRKSAHAMVIHSAYYGGTSTRYRMISLLILVLQLVRPKTSVDSEIRS
jgi:hypothetical protein